MAKKVYELVVNTPKITSDYGYRIHPIDKVKKFHYGIDVISKAKDLNLYAIDDGYVQKVVTGQDKAKTGYGNYIWVRYPRYNLSILHAHCKKVLLKKGATVKKGQVVAIIGTTGASTGVHVHIGMTRIGSDAWLNPSGYEEIAYKFNLTRVLTYGCSKGDDVSRLQTLLKALGYTGKKNKPLVIDGVFGSNTDYAVRSYQQAKKLKVDGAVGINTAHSLGWLYKGK